MTTHGYSSGLLIDFVQTTAALNRDTATRGGLVVNCGSDASMCANLRADFFELREAQWRFIQDHPYGVEVDPYADGLPEVFPEYCRVIR
jgi:hypothetical protein